MMRSILGLFAASLLACDIAFAMDGVFDRSAEVAHYIGVFETKTRGGVIEACRLIQVSGLRDEKLAAVILARLERDHASVAGRDKMGVEYVEWMMKALASLGFEEHQATLRTIRESSNVRRDCPSCDEIERVAWYKSRNLIMASRANHVEGADPRASMLLNLLLSPDPSHRHFAAERMNRERVLDPRLMQTIAAQLDEFVSGRWREPSGDRSHEQGKALGLYVKLLGYSGDVQYRDVLNRVMDSKASPQLKKHTKEALSRMRQ